MLRIMRYTLLSLQHDALQAEKQKARSAIKAALRGMTNEDMAAESE